MKSMQLKKHRWIIQEPIKLQTTPP